MRVETIERKLYQFSELSESAKEKAREWYRRASDYDSDWKDCVYEDAEQIAAILGIQLDSKRGSAEPTIWFSGFSSQGDGACFEGSYSYAKGASKKIRQYAPQDETLHTIADELADIQKHNRYQLAARVKHRGHYYHEYCTEIEVFGADGDYAEADTGDSVKEALRRFMRWIYKALESEWEYRNSDEQVDETIEANEYEFEENGERA